MRDKPESLSLLKMQEGCWMPVALSKGDALHVVGGHVRIVLAPAWLGETMVINEHSCSRGATFIADANGTVQVFASSSGCVVECRFAAARCRIMPALNAFFRRNRSRR